MIGQCCVGVRSVRNVIDSCSMIWTAVTKKLSQTEPHGGGDPVVKIILWIYKSLFYLITLIKTNLK